MALELNEQTVPFKEFYGANYKQMPLLISGKNEKGKVVDIPRIPLSYEGLMKRKLQVLNASQEIQDAWYTNYFDTGDGVATDRAGNIKIEYDSPTMRSLNPESKLKSGALVLADDAFEKIQGHEFTSKDIAKYKFNESLSESEVNEHPFWMVLAREDKALLKEYAHQIFKKAKETHGYDKNMGVYLSSFREVPNMRLWLSNRLDNDSNASGLNFLVNYIGRLVGVAPEAQSALDKSSIIIPALDDIIKISSPYVAEINRDALTKDLTANLYK
ncbi:hypothetical protein COV13_00885 [Candidatus Woesearchaeota archaeon CG10_big_fil_rev_8_21_14_0_10_32_9]|nr:MAG: hypothetical protein COV13_00885 [Candidatus Woesearchaeota archaeon CG10_big_fil_rev_8_21_14_0_10_32_9]